MWIMVWNRWIISLLWLIVTVTEVSCENPALAYVFQSSSGQRFPLNFTRDSLIEFNGCLCQSKTQSCDVSFQSNGIVGRIDRTDLSPELVILRALSTTYACARVRVDNHVKCDRIELMCPRFRNCVSVKVPGDQTMCELGQAVFGWVTDLQINYLYIGNISVSIEGCDQCTSPPLFSGSTTSSTATTTTVTTTTKKSTATTINHSQTSTSTSPAGKVTKSRAKITGATTQTTQINVHSIGTTPVNITVLTPDDDDDEDDGAPIAVIVGVMITIVFISIVAVAIGLIAWKRRKQSNADKSRHRYVNTANPKHDAEAVNTSPKDNSDAVLDEGTGLENLQNEPVNAVQSPNIYDLPTDVTTDVNGGTHPSQQIPTVSEPTHVYNEDDIGRTDSSRVGQYPNMYDRLQVGDGNFAEHAYSRLNPSPEQTAGNVPSIAPNTSGFYSNTYDHPESGHGQRDEHEYIGLSDSSAQSRSVYREAASSPSMPIPTGSDSHLSTDPYNTPIHKIYSDYATVTEDDDDTRSLNTDYTRNYSEYSTID